MLVQPYFWKDALFYLQDDTNQTYYQWELPPHIGLKHILKINLVHGFEF
jgi:hypothetical protein